MITAKQETELRKLFKEIPKEYHKILQKIYKIAVDDGASEMRDLIEAALHVPIDKLKEYGVWHEDDIDGG